MRRANAELLYASDEIWPDNRDIAKANMPLNKRLPQILFFKTFLATECIFLATYSERYLERATWTPYPLNPITVVARPVTIIACPMVIGSVIFVRTIQKTAPIPKLARLSSIRKND